MGNSRRVNNEIERTNESKKWLSIIGLLFSIGLLVIAIVLSVNQEKIDKLASENELYITNSTMTASSSLSKSVNEKVADKKIGGEPIVIKKEKTAEINESNNQVDSEDSKLKDKEKYEYVEDEKAVKDSNEQEQNVEENTTKKNEENKQFIKPVDGDIYKEYSMDSLVYSETLQEWVTHRGVDFQVNISEDVKASASGTVKSIKNDPRYGWSIIVEHKEGFTTVYTCLVDVSLVKEGDNVEQGQIIGKAGNSGVFEFADGSHLHFEMMKDGNYINPEMYLK